MGIIWNCVFGLSDFQGLSGLSRTFKDFGLSFPVVSVNTYFTYGLENTKFAFS